MITLEDHRDLNSLTFRFPEVHEAAACGIHFQRTLRIPDDDEKYPLPPGLGAFPIRHLDDFTRRIPESWCKRGGVIMPMHQAEAMWICFQASGYGTVYPFAIKIATGKINAVSGDEWTPHLNTEPQDYIVIPEQPWLDGYCVEKGVIRQFVAMPLGEGYTAEEQLTGDAEHGGVQIIAYPMKAEHYEKLRRQREQGRYELREIAPAPCKSQQMDMGLAPGGRMEQEIYDDPYGLDAWDQRHASRCFVTIANSLQWNAITGERPPTTPPTAAEYTKSGLPWFDYYGSDASALEGSGILGRLASVKKLGAKKGQQPLPENESVTVEHPIGLRAKGSQEVREAGL